MTVAGAGPAGPTIAALVRAAAERFADRPALVDGDARLTYAELVGRARDFGAALVATGVGPGERVAVWVPNGAEWVIAALGTFLAGAVLVPVNTRFKGIEAADLLRRSSVRLLVASTDFLGIDHVALLRSTGAEIPSLGSVVVARGPAPEGTEPWATFLGRADGAERASLDRRSRALGPDDPADILFTSGTTGVPKGVVQTQRRTLAVATDWVAMTGLGPGDRYLMVNPYFHMFGLKAGILASVAAGATMLPEPVLDVERVLRRVAAERVTVLPGPPTLYRSILDHPGRSAHDLSSLRVAVTGAADIPVALIREILDELPFPRVVTGYGLTEGGTAAATGPDDDAEAVATTVGRPRPGFEVRLVAGDGADADAPPGATGEILLRGPSIMSHYLDDPGATAEVLSADGWLRTGDLGAWDGAGRLRIVGRVKDMFIVGGFNAYPAEIEGALLTHPDIRQAAVVGVLDGRLGEVGAAFVVLGPGATASGPDIIAWCRERMANYKVPRFVEILDRLPLNATGKVDKRALPVPAGAAPAPSRPEGAA